MSATSYVVSSIGPAVLSLFCITFLYAWSLDRRRRYLLLFGAAILAYCLGVASQILLWPGDVPVNALLSAALFTSAVLLCVEAILCHAGRPISPVVAPAIFVALLSAVYVLTFVRPSLLGRIYVLNFTYGLVFLWTAMRLWRAGQRPIDRLCFWLVLAFAIHFPIRILLSVGKSAPRGLENFLASPFWLATQFSISVFGAALALSILVATTIDVIDELKRERGMDALTSLLNRRSFDEIADGAPPARPLAAILADLDHFKAINDRFGHAAGDKVLRAFAAILRQSVRHDDMVSRIGGEEFVILLPGTELAAARLLAERIRGQVAAARLPALPAGHAVTASFGVAAQRPGETVRALVARADRSLYAAKQAGRNRVMVDESTG